MDAPDHILIVDDDAEIRNLLSKYLLKNGLRVSAAANGRAMWQALEAGRIDLIVLDLMLPGEDGLTLCRTLRAKSSDIPVIMLTARGEETDRIVGLEMGADDYLAKPFSARELLARIKVVLRRARSLPHNLRLRQRRIQPPCRACCGACWPGSWGRPCSWSRVGLRRSQASPRG